MAIKSRLALALLSALLFVTLLVASIVRSCEDPSSVEWRAIPTDAQGHAGH